MAVLGQQQHRPWKDVRVASVLASALALLPAGLVVRRVRVPVQM